MQENTSNQFDNMGSESVVISGISGVFPKCENMLELSTKLFAKEDLITDFPEINFSLGKLNDVSKFDANFFEITNEHADYMDPMARILLEKTYEAIVDSGYNPLELHGSNTPVFIANTTSDAEVEGIQRHDVKGAMIVERAQSFLANRISYWLNVHGTSCVVNTACSSSFHALEFAYKAIVNGECDSAIVGGTNLCLSPDIMRSYKNLGVTSQRCYSFDDAARGFCRSESICAIFVQKASIARRKYATIVHVKTNADGYKRQSILFPSDRIQKMLINQLYEECDIEKRNIAWVEAHGTGTRVGDYQEMISLSSLCEGRSSVLHVGCVKSNLGHTEATSGLCSIAKVIIAMETGIIPPNINFTKLQTGIEKFCSGKIEVISEKMPWDGGLVAINNFGIGGANAHILLQSNPKEKLHCSFDGIPRLVTVSGVSYEAVNSLLNKAEEQPWDVEFISLLHTIYRTETKQHRYRGYALLEDIEKKPKRDVQKIPEDRREVWFVFSGMGSQWASMGSDLLGFSIFKNSIEKCHSILKEYGVNIMEILTAPTDEILDDILNCFVGIVAIQIALVDLLISVGITPDKTIGHSLGEVGSAYAVGSLTMEQALLVAYYRGLVSTEIKTIQGSMAVVGLHHTEAKKICCDNIDIACENSHNNSVISGPADEIRNIVVKLQKQNIFAAEIKCGSIAFHSRYIRNMENRYRSYLKKVIPFAVARPTEWISTSVKQSENIFCSAEYFVNNMIGKVYFENALKNIPRGAIVIEISPHSTLLYILKASLDDSILSLQLMNRYFNNIQFLLQSLAMLYVNGISFDVSKLYSKVAFPVSRGTRMISPLIKWNHNKNWYVPYSLHGSLSTAGRLVPVNLQNKESQYLQHHVIDNRIVLPESLYLIMVWEALAAMYNRCIDDLSVIFTHITFYKCVHINMQDTLYFAVQVQRKSGSFEISLNKECICKGFIFLMNEKMKDKTIDLHEFDTIAEIETEFIYKELTIRGYNYQDSFQGIIRSNIDGTCAYVKWRKHWVTYLNSIFQINNFSKNTRSIEKTNFIERIAIDVEKHSNYVKCGHKQNKGIPVKLFKCGTILSGGVQITNLRTIAANRFPFQDPILQTITFMPHISSQKIDIDKIISLFLTIVLDNTSSFEIKVLERIGFEEGGNDCISPIIEKCIKTIPFYNVEINKWLDDGCNSSKNIAQSTNCDNKSIDTKIHIFITSQLFCKSRVSQGFLEMLDDGIFIIAKENLSQSAVSPFPDIITCACYPSNNFKILLLRKVKQMREDVVVIPMYESNFNWITNLQNCIQANENGNILLTSEKESYTGIIGFYKSLKRENPNGIVRCMAILDDTALQFDQNEPFYANQIAQNLNINVFNKGSWGSYVFLPIVKKTKSVNDAYVGRILSEKGSDLVWIQRPINVTREVVDNSRIYVAFSLIRETYYTDTKPSVLSDNETTFIVEFSGRDKNGKHCMGLSKSSLLTTTLLSDEYYSWAIPDGWTLQEAVTVPFAYTAAILALVEFGQINKNQSILLSGHYEDITYASIQIAMSYGCKIFLAVESSQDMEFVQKYYKNVTPILTKIENMPFEEQILNATDRIGVDVVVNINIDESSLRCVQCLAVDGLFLNIQLTNPMDRMTLGSNLLKCINFRNICVLDILRNQPIKIQRVLKILNEKIQQGFVKPMNREKVFDKGQLSSAFECMKKTKNPVVIQIRDNDLQMEDIDKSLLHEAVPRYICSKYHSYVICGGLGGMGFELVHWLITRGARILIVVSRKGFYDGYKMVHIERWRSQGIKLIISTEDITTCNGVENLLKDANAIAPVIAIFNTALILRDGMFINQSKENFEIVAGPKATAAILLDKLSRNLCEQLEQFVLFSSIACGYGNAGQTNYGYANSVMERICENRRADGFPALAIEWSGVDDVGYLKENNARLNNSGTLLQPIRSCLTTLDWFLTQKKEIVSSYIVNEIKTTEKIQCDTIVSRIEKITGKKLEKLEKNLTLREIGIDSITAVETKQILQDKYDMIFTTKQVEELAISDVINIELACDKKGITKINSSTYRESILKQLYVNYLQLVSKDDEYESVYLKQIVRLPSLLDSGSTIERSTQDVHTIFMFPSIEGIAAVMEPIASRIDQQVLCFQYNPSENSITDIADSYVQHIRMRLQHDEEFYILGYSYGGLIALEVVRILESEGKSGYLYLIDSSIKVVKRISQVLFHENDLHSNLLTFIKAALPRSNINDIKSGIENFNNWTAASKYAISSLPDNIPYKKEKLLQILDSIYFRHMDIKHYPGLSNECLKCKPFLIKAATSILEIPQDYELSQYFENPVEENIVDGNHFTVLKSEKLAYLLMNLHK